MKILVASTFEAGSRYAHAINVIKMAEGFALLGHEVVLACHKPEVGSIDFEAISRQYALRTDSFTWNTFRPLKKGTFINLNWKFALQLLPLLIRFRPDFVYSRDFIIPCFTSSLRIPTAGESHAAPDDCDPRIVTFARGARRYAKFKTLVTIAPVLKDGFIAKGAPEEKVIVLPDAVDLHIFDAPLELPCSPFSFSGKNVVYSGHLYDYKGIPTILEAAKLLPDVIFHLIGGHEADIAAVRNTLVEQKITNVLLHGFKPREDLPLYLWHADALLLVPSGKHPSAAWTSPVKLGEYLASGTPIIASRIPALTACLTDKEAYFTEPDNAADVAQTILTILNDPASGSKKALAAKTMAQELSYKKRAERVLDHTFCFEC